MRAGLSGCAPRCLCWTKWQQRDQEKPKRADYLQLGWKLGLCQTVAPFFCSSHSRAWADGGSRGGDWEGGSAAVYNVYTVCLMLHDTGHTKKDETWKGGEREMNYKWLHPQILWIHLGFKKINWLRGARLSELGSHVFCHLSIIQCLCHPTG